MALIFFIFSSHILFVLRMLLHIYLSFKFLFAWDCIFTTANHYLFFNLFTFFVCSISYLTLQYDLYLFICRCLL